MKTFIMATQAGALEVPYISEFKWGGEMFIINRPMMFGMLQDDCWRASHKETGFGLGPRCSTWREAKKKAIVYLESKGVEKLQKAIRKAKRQIKKEHMK